MLVQLRAVRRNCALAAELFGNGKLIFVEMNKYKWTLHARNLCPNFNLISQRRVLLLVSLEMPLEDDHVEDCSRRHDRACDCRHLARLRAAGSGWTRSHVAMAAECGGYQRVRRCAHRCTACGSQADARAGEELADGGKCVARSRQAALRALRRARQRRSSAGSGRAARLARRRDDAAWRRAEETRRRGWSALQESGRGTEAPLRHARPAQRT